MVSRAAAIASAYVWLVACVSRGADALRCPVTGAEAPTEVTLMASPMAPTTDAIALAPNCSYSVLKINNDGVLSNTDPMSSASSFFDRVASVPSLTKVIEFTFSEGGIPSGLDLSAAANVKKLTISGGSATALENFKFPRSLELLGVAFSPVASSFESVNFPPTVTALAFILTNLSTLPKLPPKLRTLELDKSNISTIDFDYPSTVKTISFNSNPIKNLGPATLPPGLESFSCKLCMNEFIGGIVWPSTLTDLALNVAAYSEVEIRQSDINVFTKFISSPFVQGRDLPGLVTRTNCSDETATIVNILDVDVCVITDDRFESRYGKPPTASGDSASGSSSGSGISPPLQSTSTPGRGGSTNGVTSGGQPTASTNQPESSSSVSTALIVVAVVLGVIVLVALAVIGYRMLIGARNNEDKSYHGIVATTNNTTEDGSAQRPHVDYDIRNDPSMRRLYIDLAEVHMGAVVACSSSYETVYGEYNRKRIVIKRLSGEAAARNDQALAARFMEEIRTCSTLDHPQIVELVGVTWSQHKGLAMLSEYMEGGDLSTLLQKQRVPPSPQDWFQPWTTTKIKSKALIARDVVEVIVYLHSFTIPILHRNLKARNVLLDKHGSAKLNDVGVVSLMAVNESIPNYVAWIAPEVLRGDQYSEKVDIYALGVLLAELDRCRPLYVEETGANHKEIAAAVASGRTRPSTTDGCPAPLQALVAKCVSFEAEDRPTAMEVNFLLRKMLRQNGNRAGAAE